MLEGVSIGVVEGKHKQKERLLGKFLMVQGDACRKRAHASFGKRNGIELLPHLKPPGDLILIEGFQSDGHGALGNPGTIGDRDTAANDDSQRSALVGLSLLEGLHAQQKIGLHDASGLEQLIKSVEYHDRQRSGTRFNELRPWNPFTCHAADSKLDLVLQVRFCWHQPQFNPDRQEGTVGKRAASIRVSTDLPEPGCPSKSRGAFSAFGEVRYSSPRKRHASSRIDISFHQDSRPGSEEAPTSATRIR